LKGMEKATTRFDLEGNAAAEVTELHRSHATETLRERSKKIAALRKAKREAEEVQRKAAEAQRKADEAARQRAEKLSQLTAKFSRRTG
jgi:ProP effector